MSTYPGTIDSFTAKTDTVDDVNAADINELQAAIVAIETELGTDVAGTRDSLYERLDEALSGSGVLELGDFVAFTIVSGAIDIDLNLIKVDTEGGAGSDDLDTINGYANGMLVLIRIENSARHVVIKHNTGNILCTSSDDITLSETNQFAFGYYDNALSKWVVGPVGTLGIPKVKKEIIIDSIRAKAGAAAPTSTIRAVGASGNIQMAVQSFSKTTQQDCYFELHTPFDLDPTEPINFHLMWQPGASWTSGNYMWKLEYLVKDEDGATLLAGTPTTIEADVTPTAATKDIETEFSGDITMAADQRLLCHFYRDVASDNGDDTGEVAFFEFEYTSDILGETI